MALFVIYGKPNSGKTSTCWMIYNLLMNAGTELDFAPKSLSVKPTFSEVLQQIEKSSTTGTQILLPDFRALFDYLGKKVAIFSAGDQRGDDSEDRTEWNDEDVVDFVNNMRWAKQNNVEHVICCSRSLNRTGSVQRYILDNYRMSVYRWYYKTQTSVLKEQIADAQRVALEVFRDIKIDY